ncbi:acetyltransferase [Terrimonas pollutisoli]|uniref:acetyltransferase n=1 Tax=Terrimonas pollutisoli TaxID=3034147 RepID=UPI0023EBED94|nr:acetyltransferase [Terrimonas sp. H1YJ31]
MIRKADNILYSSIIEIWELSVRATHHFLPEDYLQTIKKMLPDILPQVDIFIYQDKKARIKGFLGVADQKIEMLFIHPGSRGEGIGKALTDFAIHELHANTVDVNEQNEQAIGFYKHLGFVETGRSETDGMGKPFPLIHMKLVGE